MTCPVLSAERLRDPSAASNSLSFTEALRFLDKHINREANAGSFEGLNLDVMHEMMSLSADPHVAYRTIHVTGTNGKGSTATMIARILQESGLRVGRYSSPHLESVTERIEVDGEPISREDFAAEILSLAHLVELTDAEPSYFELLTAAAFRWFAEVAVDVAVVEVGVLGRFDATNVIDADVAVITNIGKDHTDGSDGWERKIADEKAGISKPSSVLVVGESNPDLLDVFEAQPKSALVVAERDFELLDSQAAVGGRLVSFGTPRGRHEDVFMAVHGEHQARNAALAVAAIEEFFDGELEEDVLASALGQLKLPGRAEVVSAEPIVLLDGAHNPDAAAELRSTLDTSFAGASPRVYVIGMQEPRDPNEFLHELGIGPGDVVVATPVRSGRAISTDQLVQAGNALEAVSESSADVEDALERAKAIAGESGIVVVTGSLYTVGEATASDCG